MQISTEKLLISSYKAGISYIQINLNKNCLTNKKLLCVDLSVLLLYKYVTVYLDNISTYDEFSNWLKINYKGFYGWQKVYQIFMDNFQPEDNYEKDLVEKIQSLSLPSTFEIPSNWTIYAPILR